MDREELRAMWAASVGCHKIGGKKYRTFKWITVRRYA